MDALLPIAMRWLHLISIIILLGGVFYARFIVGDLAPGFKKVAYWTVGTILVSGAYNFLSKTVYPPHYHAWFGVKVLLALHIFAVTILYKGGRSRSLTGVVISGAVVVAISGYLRWLSLL